MLISIAFYFVLLSISILFYKVRNISILKHFFLKYIANTKKYECAKRNVKITVIF
jgi:hypothetical protein